ncbi:MAG TPA: hypothetical protein VME01_09445, partial [Solirubrobacteraceae bacterium]|nr:hypothetical protein [Solirubrobacteraceae bacterium]
MSGELVATDRPLEDARRALRGYFTTEPGPSESFERAYYDTFDGLLHEEGLTLCNERDRWVLSSRDGAWERSGPEPDE